jgi:hypothetical protein
MKTACNLYENFDFILTFVVEMTYINKQFMINIYAIKVDYPTRVVVSYLHPLLHYDSNKITNKI